MRGVGLRSPWSQKGSVLGHVHGGDAADAVALCVLQLERLSNVAYSWRISSAAATSAASPDAATTSSHSRTGVRVPIECTLMYRPRHPAEVPGLPNVGRLRSAARPARLSSAAGAAWGV